MTESPHTVKHDERPFLTALRLYRECGFNVIPLRPREKRPPEGFEWKPYQTRRATEEEIFSWDRQWPDANWAVICGTVSGLAVLDADDAEAVRWLEENMPATTFQVATSRGRHFYYRVHKGQEELPALLNFRSRGICVDVQRDGKYVVAPGSVHPSGAVYALSPDADWAKGPRGIVNPFHKMPLSGGRETPARTPGMMGAVDISDVDATFTPVGTGGRHPAMLSRVAALVNMGLTPDRAQEEAKKVNLQICKPPLPEAEVRKMVNDMFRKDVGARKEEPAEEPAPAKAAKPASFVPDTTDPLDLHPWTEETLHPGGILEDVMRYIEGASVRTDPVFALAGAVAALGSLLGQKIQTETGLLTNMYCMAVGGSASGKDAPKRALVSLLEAVAPGEIYAGSDVSSDVAILANLNQRGRHRACMVFDEVGLLLQACKKPNSAKASVVKLLTELFSGYGTPYTKIYASTEANVRLQWHALSILGLSVPEEFYGAMQDGEAVNGWLARNLVFEVRGEPGPKRMEVDRTIPPALLESLKALWAIDGHEVETGPSGKTEKGGDKLDPIPASPDVVRLSPEAKDFHWKRDCDADRAGQEAERNGERARSSILLRSGEHAWKLALIHAASRLGARVVDGRIEIEDVRWAWAVVDVASARLGSRVGEMIFSSDFDRIRQRFREAVQRYMRIERAKGRPKPGAPLSFIARALRDVPPKTLEEVIKSLTAAKEVFYLEGWKASEKSKRELNLYCLGRELDEDEPSSGNGSSGSPNGSDVTP